MIIITINVLSRPDPLEDPLLELLVTVRARERKGREGSPLAASPLPAQGCGLGLDVSVSRPSRDVLTSRLGLVSDKLLNVSVSSRSRTCASRVSSRSRPKRSRRLVSGLGPFRLVSYRCAMQNFSSPIQASMP